MKKSVCKKSYHDLVEKIQQSILNNELKVGDKLPPEREMSEIHNISRNSVREALRTLEVVGLIECRHGEGNFIANRVDGCVINALSALFVLNKGSIVELLQVRRSIELGAARNIIERKRKADAQILREIIEEYNEEADVEACLDLDDRFHRAIVHLSGNTLYKIIFDMLSALILPDMRRVVKITVASDAKNDLYAEHLALLKAIEDGDIHRADTILTKHMLLDSQALAALDVSYKADLSFLQDRISA